MESLSDLQRRMVVALRHGTSLTRDAAWQAFAGENVSGNDRLSPVEQLDIYREQFWLRHTGSLVEDFPGLGGILGQQDWERLVEQYLAEVVPDSYTLRDLGQRLPEVIERASWLPHQTLCRDMARLELAYIEVFDAADTPPLPAEKLAALSEADLPRARLVIAPCVRLLEVEYPVADLRRALRQSGDEPVPIPSPERQQLVVYRRDLQLWDMPLRPVAHAFLRALASGSPLEEAAASVVTTPEAETELASGLGNWLQEWTSKGLVSDVIVR